MNTIELVPETGVKIFDNHHKKYYELLVDLNEIIQNRTCKPDLPTFMHKLSFFAENFFLDEELALSNNLSPNLKLHKEEHRKFVDSVREFQQRFIDGDNNICRSLFDFLTAWFYDHVHNYDDEATQFLIGKVK